MERKDLLQANASIFLAQGKDLNNANPTCKVVVVGNPCNTNCLILQSGCSTVPRQNFTCLSYLDHLRTKGLLAQKLNLQENDAVENVFVLGNHSATQVPVVDQVVVSKVENGNTTTLPLKSLLNDSQYLYTDLIKQVQTRGATVIKARGSSSAASAATAISKQLRLLHLGSDKIESLGIYSDGTHYGFDSGIWASMPVKFVNGN